MSQIDFSKVLTDLDGKPLEDDSPENGKLVKRQLTLGMICINAVLAAFQDETNLSGEEKLKRFDLAMAIHAAKDPLDLPSEDIVKIKSLVAKGYSTLLVGQVWRMLEGQA